MFHSASMPKGCGYQMAPTPTRWSSAPSTGLAGVAATLAGSLLPSTTLALAATRYSEQRRDSRFVRAFTAGLAPLTLGLLLATGWILTEPIRHDLGAMLLVPLTVWLLLKTRLSPVWLVAMGAVAGALGLAG